MHPLFTTFCSCNQIIDSLYFLLAQNATPKGEHIREVKGMRSWSTFSKSLPIINDYVYQY